MGNKPQLYKFADIEHRLHTLEPGQPYIKPFVTSKVSDTMCGGLNFLNNISVPWDLTCDEIIYCMKGTFRLTCNDVLPWGILLLLDRKFSRLQMRKDVLPTTQS